MIIAVFNHQVNVLSNLSEEHGLFRNRSLSVVIFFSFEARSHYVVLAR